MIGVCSFLAPPRAAAQDGDTFPGIPAEVTGESELVPELGAFRSEITDLSAPSDATFDAKGRIIIADEGSHQIKVYAAREEGVTNWQRIAAWGRRGTGPGELLRPSGVAVSSDGDIFVADRGNHRILVFRADGTFARAWGGFGAKPGQLNTPTRVAVDGARVYVVDEGNHRIEIFDHEAIHQKSIGGYGTGDGQFRRPTGVAVDYGGHIYITDGDNARVQRFDADGKFLNAWSQWGPYPGFIMNPTGIQIQSGRAYVADSDNHRVHVFEVDGQFLYRFGVHAVRPREGGGRLHYPNSIAVSPNGKSAVVCEAFENRCQVFGVVTPDTPEDPLAGSGLDLTLVSHYGERADVDGRSMAVTEPESHSVLVFDLTPREPVWITQIGTYGRRNGEFIRPTDVKLDAGKSMLYVCDAGNCRVQIFKLSPPPADALKFDPLMAKFATSIDLMERAHASACEEHRAAAAGIEPTAIERDKQGNSYFLDGVHRRIWRFDQNWKVAAVWGDRGNEGDRWMRPTDITWDEKTQRLWVVDAERRCAFAYDRDGKFVETLRPRADLGMVEPFGLAVGPDNSFYLTDTGDDHILKYDKDGQYVKHWGRRGLGAGEMYRPTSIHLGPDGRLIVIDFGNHRGAYFSTDGEFLDVFGSRFFTAPARRSRQRD